MNKVKAPKEILTQRIMKALVIIRTIEAKHPTPLSSTPSHLAALLDVDENEIQPLLESLVDSDVLWVKANGGYEFRSGMVLVNLDEDFAKTREGMSWDSPIGVLSGEYPPSPVMAKRYSTEYRVVRALDAVYIEPSALDNMTPYEKRIQNYSLDGTILYVVAESPGEIDKARKQAINIRHPQIVIAIPKTPVSIHEELRNLKVLQGLGKEAPYNIEGTENNKIWKDRYEAQKTKLDAEIERWQKVSALDWFRNGVTLDTADMRREDIADLVMSNVFNKTPVVEHKKMANRFEQDDKSHRITLNTLILDAKSDQISFPAKGRAPAEKTILELTFKPQGMLKERTEGNLTYYKITEPTTGNIEEVWALIETCLIKSGGRAKFTQLVRDLQSPPYGLCPRVIELFVAVFLRFHRNRISIKTKRTRNSPWEKRDFIGDTIYEIVNDPDPEKVMVEYREQFPLEDDYLLEVNSIVSPNETWDSKLNAIDGVGELFVTWVQGLSPVTKHNTQSKNCKDFVERIGEVDKDDDMRELLLEKLPRALGSEKGLGEWGQEDLDYFREEFKGVVDELNNYLEEVVVRKAMESLKHIFDVKGESEYDVAAKIRYWFNKLGPAAKEHKYTGAAAALMKHANVENQDKFKDEFLIELPRELGLGEYTKWQSVEDSLNAYNSLLSKSKIEIESIHVKATGEPLDKVKGLSPRVESLKESLKQVINGSLTRRDEIIQALEGLIEEYKR